MIEAITAFDFSVLDFIRENIANPVLDVIMIIITHSTSAGAVWILATIACLIFPKTRKAGVAMAISLALASVMGNLVLKPLVDRPRPYEINTAIEIIIAEPLGSSFPSGHTIASFATATALFFFHKKVGAAALVWAALVGFSRMYLYVHFPTDVLAGIVIATSLALVIALLADKYYEPLKKRLFSKKQSID